MNKKLLAAAAVVIVLGLMEGVAYVRHPGADGDKSTAEIAPEALAAKYHPAGSKCLRYPTGMPPKAELQEAAQGLMALGLTARAASTGYGQMFRMINEREQSQHGGRTRVDEELSELEASFGWSPLRRVLFELRRGDMRDDLQRLDAEPPTVPAGVVEFSKWTKDQQAGVLQLVQTHPERFELSAFVSVVGQMKQLSTQGRLQHWAAAAQALHEKTGAWADKVELGGDDAQDDWGAPIALELFDGGVWVSSKGADQLAGTADDLVLEVSDALDGGWAPRPPRAAAKPDGR